MVFEARENSIDRIELQEIFTDYTNFISICRIQDGRFVIVGEEGEIILYDSDTKFVEQIPYESENGLCDVCPFDRGFIVVGKEIWQWKPSYSKLKQLYCNNEFFIKVCPVSKGFVAITRHEIKGWFPWDILNYPYYNQNQRRVIRGVLMCLNYFLFVIVMENLAWQN